MLSPFARSLIDADGDDTINNHWKPIRKLTPNLLDKTTYTCHYRNLQFYVDQGLKITKMHRILAFKQESWLKPWIDYCTARRMQATTEFESDLAKLMANATFGKSLENVRNRQNIRLIVDKNKLTKAESRTTFRQSEIINEDLVLVKAARRQVTLNKPISVGFAVLELSKLIMYEFFYCHLKSRYGDRCSLLFSDTDWLSCHIQTDDLYADMATDIDSYDTINFDRDHALYSTANHRVLGKIESETGSVEPKEFVGLRAKMYSLSVPGNERHNKIRVKGVKRPYVRKNVRHEQFMDMLTNLKPTSSRFRSFASRQHTVRTVEIRKSCLNAFDDKRYLLPDGVHTLAYGHRDIPDQTTTVAAAAVAYH